MMKLLSLSLFISSLVAASFLSSPPLSAALSENFKHAAASDFPRSSEEKISSVDTNNKGEEVQLEESNAAAFKADCEKDNAAGEEFDANISSAKLEKNIADIMRRARNLGFDFITQLAAEAQTAARFAAAVLHLLAFTIAFGTSVWVTFVSSHVLASGLPRQQFGIVQSRIYPLYFGAVGFSVGTAVVAFFIESGLRTAVEKAQGFNMVGVLGMIMVNLLYLEPRATKVMFERMKLEKEEGRGRGTVGDDEVAEPAMNGPTTKVVETTDLATVKSRLLRTSKSLRRLNTYSSFLNLLSLMALSWHLVYLAQRLELRC